MHWLTKISLVNRWFTLFIVLPLVGVGIFAGLHLQQELYPDVELPMTTVITIFPGASPEVIVDQVTIPVEEAVVRAGDQKRIISTSTDSSGVGMSVVVVQYEYGTDMQSVTEKIRTELSQLTWPQGVVDAASSPEVGENPKVIPINVGMIPLASYSLSGNLQPNELRQIALTEIAPALQQVSGVLLVGVEGGDDRVIITPKVPEMNARGIAMSQVVGALSTGSYDSLASVTKAPVDTAGTMVGDVATVTEGPKPGTVIARVDGKPSVTITITKEQNANVVATADRVSRTIHDTTENLNTDSNGLHVEKVSDQSDMVKSSLSELGWEAIVGGVLAILVVWLFIMTVRGSLVIAVSIPLSVLIGLAVMKAWGITLNVLTLCALGIAVGRIVDDSIVILEVIHRRLRGGEPFKEAAVNGSKEVGMAITSATLATVAIFIPLAFVKGYVGEAFLPFALTVTFAMLASLLVALTVVPALSSVLVRKQPKTGTENAWYERVYTPVLRWALRHRALTIAMALALLLLSLGLAPLLGTSFLPSLEDKGIMVYVEMDPGTDILTTSNKAEQVEDVIESLKNRPGSKIGLFNTTVGSSNSLQGFVMGASSGGNNSATIQIALSKDANVDREVKALRQALAANALAPDLESEILKVNPLASDITRVSSQFTVYVTGESDDEAQVKTAATTLLAELEEVDGLTDVEADIATIVPRPVIVPDMSTIGWFISQGMDPNRLEDEMYLMMGGADVSGASVGDLPLHINGVIPSATTGDQLRGLWFYGGLTSPIQVRNIAPTADVVPEAASISRVDQYLAVSITATVTKKDVGSVNEAAEKKMNAVTQGVPGVSTQAAGITEQMDQAFGDMAMAIVIAVAISFAILIVSFRSLITPLIIIMSLPLASIGAVVALLAAGQPIGMTAMMGILMLVGIVLTNAIVLIALVEQLRQKGMNTHDALIQAGRTRLRPILMTALATMLALAPLALGWVGGGVMLASELAVVVIGGLFSSTLLTLVVIPVLYSLSQRFRRKPSSGDKPPTAEVA
jgi:HAE1 family hydrophobic/amphiphilic exporter-1